MIKDSKKLIYLEDAFGAVVDLSGQADTKSAYAAFWTAGNELKKLTPVAAISMEEYNELKNSYKKLLETAEILDSALRAYQQKYGDLDE
jgi:chromosome segregation ATPase